MIPKINMMIVGAEKAGTSSLQQYLGQHPQICTHDPREMNFFVIEDEYQQGYEQIFPYYFSECQTSTNVVVAKSAGCMYSPMAAIRLQRHNPEVQVVILLRNPIERAYSSYWFSRRRGWEASPTFEMALKSNNGRLHRFDSNEKLSIYLEQSNYIKYLPQIFDLFDKEQIHIFLLEDLKNEAQKVCSQLFAVVHVDRQYVVDTVRHNRAAVAKSEKLAQWLSSGNTFKQSIGRLLPPGLRWKFKSKLNALNERDFVPPPINPNTETALKNYFKESVDQLGVLIGRDLSCWYE